MDAKTVAIVQSSYIPWKGYFDLMHRADELVLLDTVQFTRRDWRSRNRIKTAQGLVWLTIPVQVKGRYEQTVEQTRVAGGDWARKHWQTLRHSYARAACFAAYAEQVEDWYRRAADLESLSAINHLFLTGIAGVLGIETPLTWSRDYPDDPDPTGRLLAICRAAGATRYLSGPTAQGYLDERLFERAGVQVEYMDYGGYPVYPQLHGDFVHEVTVLDLLFHEGPRASRFMKSFSR